MGMEQGGGRRTSVQESKSWGLAPLITSGVWGAASMAPSPDSQPRLPTPRTARRQKLAGVYESSPMSQSAAHP